MKKNESRVEPVSCSVKLLSFCQELCIDCSQCTSVCQVGIMIPSPEKRKHPIVVYPGECYYYGSCAMVCPAKEVTRLKHPLMNQTKFV